MFPSAAWETCNIILFAAEWSLAVGWDIKAEVCEKSRLIMQTSCWNHFCCWCEHPTKLQHSENIWQMRTVLKNALWEYIEIIFKGKHTIFYKYYAISLGSLLTNQNSIQEEIKCRLKAGNSCYYSVQTLLSSRILSKNLKLKMYKTIILPVVLYGCET